MLHGHLAIAALRGAAAPPYDALPSVAVGMSAEEARCRCECWEGLGWAGPGGARCQSHPNLATACNRVRLLSLGLCLAAETG